MTCKDDLVLFHIMLWAPPAILTMAVLATQITICINVFLKLQGTYCLPQDKVVVNISLRVIEADPLYMILNLLLFFLLTFFRKKI
jgi:hypothetical protein